MSDRHWSYSELTTYMKCPLRHFFEYVLVLPRKTVPSALALGSAIHQGLAVYHSSVREKQPATLETVKAAFLQAWQQRKDEEVVIFQHQSEQDALDQAMTLLEVYLRQPPPSNILAVEQELLTPLANSRGEVLDKPLIGVIDLVNRDDSNLKITDIKTSSKSYTDYEAQISLQPSVYLYAAQHHYGESAVFEYQVLVKINKPRIQTITTTRLPSDFDRLGDLVEAIDRAVAAGVHYPVESAMNCSSCPYRGPCRGWQSDQTNPVSERMPLTVCQGDYHAG